MKSEDDGGNPLYPQGRYAVWGWDETLITETPLTGLDIGLKNGGNKPWPATSNCYIHGIDNPDETDLTTPSDKHSTEHSPNDQSAIISKKIEFRYHKYYE